jgi:Rap1a immunity proteins
VLRITLFLFSLVVGSSDGYAATVTANYMLPGCKIVLAEEDGTSASRNPFHQGLCLGVVDALSWVSQGLSGPVRSCVPSEVDSVQLVRIVVKYVDTHPQEMQGPFAGLALLAFNEAFPWRE